MLTQGNIFASSNVHLMKGFFMYQSYQMTINKELFQIADQKN